MSYLTDTLYVERMLRGQKIKISVAQEGGIISSIANGIRDYIMSQYDPGHPIASIVNFLGPGLLVTVSPWMGIIYELAEALGFDGKSFWVEVGKNLTEFFETLTHIQSPIKSGQLNSSEQKDLPISEQDFYQKLTDIIARTIDQSFSGPVDQDKLAQVAQKVNSMGGIPDVEGGNYKKILIKQGGTFSALKGLIGRVLKKVIPWVLKAGLWSLLLKSVAGGARGLLGIKSDPSSSSPSSGGGMSGPSNVRQPIHNLPMASSIPSDITAFHRNDMNGVWIEKGSISAIQNYLLDWILDVFPQLEEKKMDITNSTAFIEVENAFRDRNKLASGLNVYSVPHPWQRKIDIVSYIINGYLKTKGNQ